MSILLDLARMLFRTMGKKDEKESDRRNKDVGLVAVLACAYIAAVALFASALTQFLMTVFIPVSNGTSVLGIYLRNGASIACLGMVGTFIFMWIRFASEGRKSLWLFKTVTIATCIVCIAKGLLSLYFAYDQMCRIIYVVLFYLCDAAVVAIICLINTAMAALYTSLNFTPKFITWLYYLADSIAWLGLTFFFALYSSSHLVGMRLEKYDEIALDSDFDTKCDRIAKNK